MKPSMSSPPWMREAPRLDCLRMGLYSCTQMKLFLCIFGYTLAEINDQNFLSFGSGALESAPQMPSLNYGETVQQNGKELGELLIRQSRKIIYPYPNRVLLTPRPVRPAR